MLFSFLLIAGCEKEEMSIIDLSTDSTPVRNKIPCTVANMQAAYANLQNNLTAEKYPVGEQKNAGYVVTTTHYYYRFLPADITEYETLVADEVLSVSDTPFELDIENTGENYFDPELEANGSPFTYYYSVTPIGYPLPSGIQADLLAELHFTPEDEVGENPTETELQVLDFYYDLNLEALKISENLKEGEKEELTYMDIDNPDPLQSKPYDEVITDGTPFGDVIIDFSDIETFEKRRRWTPSGRITVEEDELTKISPNNNILGVRNALVKVRKWGWLPIRRAETSKSGHFSTRSTRTRRVQYAVYFQPEDKRFVVKAGTVFWDARHRGTIRYDRQPWNQHFPFGAYRSHFYALVHNASADYTFEWATPQGYGLHPVRNGIRISAKFDATGSNWTGFLHHPQTWISPITVAFNALLLSETRVSRLAGDNDNSRYRGSHGIYATTIHCFGPLIDQTRLQF
jgi:hypothetical protein